MKLYSIRYIIFNDFYKSYNLLNTERERERETKSNTELETRLIEQAQNFILYNSECSKKLNKYILKIFFLIPLISKLDY